MHTYDVCTSFQIQQLKFPLNLILLWQRPTQISQCTHFIRLYTNSSAMSRPSLEYVVSTNTSTFGSMRNLASDRWSCVWCPSGDLLLLNVPHRINGDGFVSRWINLFIKQSTLKFKILLKIIFHFILCQMQINSSIRHLFATHNNKIE